MILFGIRKKSDVNKSKLNFLLKLNPNFDDKLEELSCYGKKVFVCRTLLPVLKTWGRHGTEVEYVLTTQQTWVRIF